MDEWLGRIDGRPAGWPDGRGWIDEKVEGRTGWSIDARTSDLPVSSCTKERRTENAEGQGEREGGIEERKKKTLRNSSKTVNASIHPFINPSYNTLHTTNGTHASHLLRNRFMFFADCSIELVIISIVGSKGHSKGLDRVLNGCQLEWTSSRG